jgi:hypothetical protein
MIGWEIHERRDAMKEYVVWFEALPYLANETV